MIEREREKEREDWNLELLLNIKSFYYSFLTLTLVQHLVKKTFTSYKNASAIVI